MAQKELKIIFSGDTTPYRKEIDKAALATNKLKNEAGGAMSQLAGVFGVNIGQIKGSIDGMSKGFTTLLTSMRASTAGASVVSGAMNVVKIAIASTGVGLLIVALGSLIAYFTGTREGANFVKQVMASLGAVVRVVVDHFSSFGEGIVKLFKGDWSGSAAAFKSSVTGIGSDMLNAGKAASDLEKRTQSLNKVERESMVANAEKLAQAADLREQAADKENFSAAQRKKMLSEARTLMKEVSDEEIGIAKGRLAIHQEQMALRKASGADLTEERDLKMRVFEIDRNSSMEQKGLMKAYNATNKEIAAQTEELRKKAIEKRKEEMGEKPTKAFASEVTVTTKMADTGGLKDVQRFKDQLNSAKIAQQELAGGALDVSSTVREAFSTMAVGVGEFFGNLAAGKGSMQDFGSFLAGSFADLAVTVGKQMIQFGIAGIALRKLMISPGAALAAGIGLVALGTMARAKISASLASGGGATGAASSGGGGDFNSDSRQAITGSTMKNINITVGGQFTLQNGVLVAAVNQEEQRKAIVT